MTQHASQIMLSAFPHLLPGEHILSAAVRACQRTSATSADRFFQSRFGGSIDLRCPTFILAKGEQRLIGAIAQLFNIEAWELATRHTTITYFFNALTNAQQQTLMQRYTAVTPFKLSRQNAPQLNRPWRWCPMCSVEDFETCGNPYWHVAHQFHGIQYCNKHTNCRLIDYCVHCGASHQTLKNLALPPVTGKCPACNETVTEIAPQPRRLPMLEHWLHQWLQLPLGTFSAEDLQVLYQWNVKTQRRFGHCDIAPVYAYALCTHNKKLQPWFEKSVQDMIGDRSDELTSDDYAGWPSLSLHALMVRKNPVLHPALHALMSNYLYGSMTDLVRTSASLKVYRLLEAERKMASLKSRASWSRKSSRMSSAAPGNG